MWQGLGFLVAVFVFGAALLCNLIFDALYGAGYYSAHYWTVGVAFLAAALPSALVGRALRKRHARTVLDLETGEVFVLDRAHHSLLFIAMHHWGWLLGLAGILLLILEVVL